MRCQQCRRGIRVHRWHFAKATNEVLEWRFCESCWPSPARNVYPTKAEAIMEQITYNLTEL